MGKKILGATLGHCVHVAGILAFLRLAEGAGHETHFLGPAVDLSQLIAAAREWSPDLLAISYRLTPEVAKRLFVELKQALAEAGLSEIEMIFGGTPPVAVEAERCGMFTRVFTGDDGPSEVMAFLHGETSGDADARAGSTLLTRMKNRAPYPLLRHHFGLPKMSATLEGVRRIAEAKVLDIISLGPDQNAQSSFFRPEEMDPSQSGAGGVPLRSPDDLRAIYDAAQTGNYPLLRCYSGTRDVLKWAEMTLDTIHNAWAAIPLCWYNVLDGRSNRSLEQSMAENLAAMAWHAARGIPVEVNEAHHWSLREAPDTVAVVAAYLAALNAKHQGVEHYIAQYMFNTPYGTSYGADLAKMLAKRELIQRLHDHRFRSYSQVRTGLMSLASNMSIAKGQLASSIQLAMQMKPDIVHVVGFSEANYAATADVVIESCQIIHGVLRSTLQDLPDATLDPKVQERKRFLISEAEILLGAIAALGDGPSPLTDPQTIIRAIGAGLLDAPHLKGSRVARGTVSTRMINGACWAVDRNGGSMDEKTRIARLFADQTPCS